MYLWLVLAAICMPGPLVQCLDPEEGLNPVHAYLDEWFLLASKSATPEEWKGVLPLGCDEQDNWREFREVLESSPRSEPDNTPCAAIEDFGHLLNMGVELVFGFGLSKFEGWFGSGIFCTSCEILVDNPQDAFCTFGLLSALACVLRLCAYSRKHYPEDWEVTHAAAGKDTDGTEREPVCDLAYKGLMNMLMTATNFVELLHDSGWPWTLRGLWTAVGEWNEMEHMQDGALRAAASSYFDVQAARRQLIMADRAPTLLAAGAGAVRIFAVGMHSGLLQEPLLALRAAAPEGMGFEYVAPCGGDHFCHHVSGASCAERDSSFAEILERHLDKQFSNSWQNMHKDRIANLQGMRREFVRTYAEAMRSSDLLICSEPLAFCSFFEGSGLPVISYMGNGEGFYLSNPNDVTFVMESVSRMNQQPRNTFFTTNAFLAARMDMFYNMQLTSAMPMARHLGDLRYSYAPESVRGMGKLLVTKRVIASWDIRCMTQTLLIRAQIWLGSLLAQEDPDFAKADLRGAIPIPEVLQIGELKKDQQPFEVWATFRAVLVLPWDASNMNLYDLYALGLPLFVPDPVQFLPPFLFRFMNGISFKAMFGKNRTIAPVTASSQVPWLESPYTKFFPILPPRSDHVVHVGGWDSQRAWSLLSDFAHLPHLRHFVSLAELIPQLLDVEALRTTSLAMQAEHQRMEAESTRLWAGALSRALSGEPASPGGGWDATS